jgi:pantoate--beta-alanine ligase
MGFLHEGHLALMEMAARQCDTVVASVFVNPLQFGPDEDLDSYPRDVERDQQLAADAGVDVLFAPSGEEMYSDEPQTRVTLPHLSYAMEGSFRPGHFDGVATVVAKLFAGIQPDAAYFGRKDAQQLAVVRRMTTDLSFPVEIVPVPIVRTMNGLALSSRNRYLNREEREAALCLAGGLMAAADLAEAGEFDADVLESASMQPMNDEPLCLPEYATLADAETANPIGKLDRPAFLAVAARIGETRLIDNVFFEPTETGVVADRGWRLDRPSVLEQG